MDIFLEQLVKIKNNVIDYIVMALLIAVALVLAVVLFIYSGAYPILIFGIVAVVYGTIKLLGMFYKEYEYILTNGTLDIDRITAKSSRVRLLSFECTDIIRAGRYNPKNPPVTDASQKYICANTDNAYYLLVKKESRKVLLVVSLNDKMLAAIKESLPRAARMQVFAEV